MEQNLCSWKKVFIFEFQRTRFPGAILNAPGSPEASDNAPRVTRSQWQRPPGHQEPVIMPPGSPGASDNALRVTRSQWQRPLGHQEPASTPQATRTQCLRPRATRSHWERPQTTESQRPYHTGSPGAASMPQDLQEEMDTVTANSPPWSRHVPWLVTLSYFYFPARLLSWSWACSWIRAWTRAWSWTWV